MKSSSAQSARILIADDQKDVLEALRFLFKGEGWQVQTADSPQKVLRDISDNEFDLLLIDLNYARDTTSGAEGLDLLEKLHGIDATLPVVVMTAWGSVELAVEAMRRGAQDFIQKPWENARVLAIARAQIQLGQALRHGRRLEAENKLLRGESSPDVVAESPKMKAVLSLAQRVAGSDASVLITGEHGTGKGVVASLIHAASGRASKPLVTVNTAGLAEGVFASELFGHVKGAFTDAKADRVGRFELAEGGTLFLDEIANVPLPHQPKLLRVLETGEFERVGSSKTRRANVRILSATNADLREEVKAGRFREDLLFRLNTIEIHLPPLRERREDIPAFVRYFAVKLGQRYRKSLVPPDEPVLRLLMNYSWPGNVRELSHAMERAVLLAEGPSLRASDFALGAEGQASSSNLDEMSLEEVEAYLMRKTLARFDGNVSKAAEALGLSRSAFYRRLEKYGL